MKKNLRLIYDKDSHITHTEYFSFKEEAKANSLISMLLVSLRLMLKTINSIMRPLFGFELKRSRVTSLEDQNFSSDDVVKKMQGKKVNFIVESFLSELGIQVNSEDLLKTIEDYDSLYRNAPINNHQGGMGYNNGLVCFCFIKTISPDLVIESGVWRGFTTFLIDKATQEASKIKCFDINYSKLDYKSNKAEYFESDVSEATINLKETKALALFDDHVSHYDRLEYCLDNGVDFIIFDDDVSIENVHSDGWPPIPTANMVMNYDSIPHKFSWVSGHRVGEADISELDCKKFQNSYLYVAMPDLYGITGYQNSSATSFLVKRMN